MAKNGARYRCHSCGANLNGEDICKRCGRRIRFWRARREGGSFGGVERET